ncbi:MAG: serine/threonine-protein kinase [Polyangiales bacterium]
MEDPSSAEALAATVHDSAPQPEREPSGDTPLPRVDLHATTLDDVGHVARYKVRAKLGEGGMGEVHLCRDRRVGRDVAMKLVRPEHRERDEVHARFLREARVQGQLEHPSIVPVYDLAVNDEGVGHFTMKRVRGMTLDAVIRALAAGDAEAAERFSRHKLLTAFTTVCNAVDYAHHRGVIHRDLKPENVMLGDYGEVYVLDWGVARILDAPDLPAPQEDPVEVYQDPSRRTVAGSVVGTLGYMAPEQLRGEAVTPRSDVYALGAILYELLAGAPLHGGESAEALMTSTLTRDAPRLRERAPEADVPPELEAICARAVALDPDARFVDARSLCDAVEGFLEGDRDLERRREMARGHAERADALADKALELDSETHRREAIREAGRALALDPGAPDAVSTLVRLLLAPPKSLPAEVQARVSAQEWEQVTVALRSGTFAYLMWIPFVLVCFAVGVRDVPRALVEVALFLAVAAMSWVGGRSRERPPWLIPSLALGSTLAVVNLSSFFGPLVLVPPVLVANTAAFALTPSRVRTSALVTVAVVSFVGLVLAPYLGLIPASYAFDAGVIRVLPRTVAFHPLFTPMVLFTVHAAVLVIAAQLFMRLGRSLRASIESTSLLTWQLQQIVPEAARGVSASTPPRPRDECAVSG